MTIFSLQSLFSIALLSLFVSNAQSQLTVLPTYSAYYVQDRGTISLSCKYTGVANSLTWTVGGQPLDSLEFSTQVLSGGNEKTITAVKNNVSESDTGLYVCTATLSGGAQVTANKTITVFKVNLTEPTFVRGMDVASLGCRISSPTMNEMPKYWLRNHKNLNEFDDHETKYFVHPENYTLDIIEPDRTFADEYQCVIMFSDVNVSVSVNFYATPLVRKFEKSKNLVNGEDLELKCAVYGHPLSNVTWMKNDEVIYEVADRISFSDYQGVPNAMIKIEKVEFEDKGTYMCIGTSSVFNTSSNSTILVRVKDKLAALWPFLGIVAEVIILCIIIFIYEKKRSKDEAVEEDDTNVKSGNTNAAESNEVRQRNVRA